MSYVPIVIIIALVIFIYVYRRSMLVNFNNLSLEFNDQSLECQRQLRIQMKIVDETKASFDSTIAEQHENCNARIRAITSEYTNRTLLGSIYKSLSSMDKIPYRYEDENEANRELASCLSVLGHTCSYQQLFNNGRKVDIYVDETAIIEGKLEPQRSEIDRLIGQIEDYMRFGCHIYIVIYGRVNPDSIARINNHIIVKRPDEISLIYLPHANRRNKMEATNE